MLLKTELCERLNIEYPIIQAAMGGVSLGRLAAAVSEVGGLGTIASSKITPEELELEIKLARSLTGKPIAVNIPFPVRAANTAQEIQEPETLPKPIQVLHQEMQALGVQIKNRPKDPMHTLQDAKKKLEVVLDYRIPVLSCALGTPDWVVQRCHQAGIILLSPVGSVKNALRVESKGVDFVIAQGYEAGGHTGEVGLLSLLPQVMKAVSIPVIAAGGFASGKQVAAALAMGAVGVVIGTRFLATHESCAEENYKQAIVEAGETGTIRSLIYDGLYVRQLINRFTEVWKGFEHELQPYPVQRLITSPIMEAAAAANLKEYMAMPAGQSSALISEILPAGKVLLDLVAETIEALKELPQTVQYA